MPVITSTPYKIILEYLQQAELLPTDRQTSDLVGLGVAISKDGTTALVGAPGEDGLGGGSGAAYIFV